MGNLFSVPSEPAKRTVVFVEKPSEPAVVVVRESSLDPMEQYLQRIIKGGPLVLGQRGEHLYIHALEQLETLRRNKEANTKINPNNAAKPNAKNAARNRSRTRKNRK